MIPGIKKRALNFHDVLMYVAVGRKHLRLMVLLMCFTLLAGLVYYVYARPVYYSKSLVKLDYMPLPMDTDKLYNDGRIPTVIKELTSPPVMERTAKALGIEGSARQIQLRHIFKKSVRLTTEKNLEIQVWPATRELANRWVETMVREFLTYRQERRIKARQDIEKAYAQEVKEVTDKLYGTFDEKFENREEQEVTKVLIELNSMSGIPAELVRITRRIDEMGRLRVKLQDPSLSTVAKLSLIASLSALTPDLSVGEEVSMSDAQSFNENDNDGEKADSAADGRAQSRGVVVLPSMVSQSHPWEELERQQQQIQSDMEQAAATFLPGHQKMVALRKNLDEVNRKLDAELRVAENRFGLEYQELLNKRSDLEGKLPEYEEINKKSARIRVNQGLFNNAQLPWRQMHSRMTRRLEALDFASDKERVDLEFLSVVEQNDAPVSPNRGKLLLVSACMGLVLAIGIPFLIEYLDHTLSNLEQVETTFQLRGLGIVPKLANENSGPGTLIDRETIGEGNLVENFRVIRANLLSTGALSKPPHVMMVTSAMPKEGKTVVSSNLAMSFAHMGARTLLMDTDLRRGRLHRLFGYRKTPGLSNVLMDEATLDEAIRPTTYPNLSILSAGKHLETGTELLGSSKFQALMGDLRERFDRIIVDTPPVLGLSETSILQPMVDGVLFVIWSGNTPIRNMKAAIEMLQSNGANFYGFVLNRLDLNATTNYYQYYYYHHDYYYHYRPHALENA